MPAIKYLFTITSNEKSITFYGVGLGEVKLFENGKN